MSQYKKIATEFKNLDSLILALTDLLGVGNFTVDKTLSNKLSMYGYHGDERPEKASINVSRTVVNKQYSGGSSNDFGFAYDQAGKMFTAIISDFDSTAGTMRLVEQLRQKYAYHEVVRQAKMKGYSIRQVESKDKTIRLQLVKL